MTMAETKQIQQTAPGNSTEMLRAMVGIGIMCALLIVLVFEGTKPIIAENQAEALEKAIFQVLPGTATTQAFMLNEANEFVPASGDEKEGRVVYAGYDEEKELTGLAIEASGQGYAGIIRILYGYDPDQQAVIGFHVLESKETPGLGDKIENDPNFLANFEALNVSVDEGSKALQNAVIPVKQGAKSNSWEVEGITGATISSRAIGDIISSSSEFWVPLIYRNQEDFAIKETNSEKAQQ